MAIDLSNTEADESWLHDLFDEATNDDWAGFGDTVQQKYAALFGKAFNPDEPRGGGPHHGEWTAGGSSGGTVSDMPGDSWGEKYDNWVAQQNAISQAIRERVARQVNDALGKKEEPPPGPVKDAALGEWKPSMTEAEADAWAVGPYAKQQFIHSTSPEGAKNIPVEGFRPGSDSSPHIYGRGIYVAAADSNRSGMGADLPVRVSGKFFDYNGPEMFTRDYNPGPLPRSPEFKALEAKYEAAGATDAFGSALTDILQARGYDGVSYNDLGRGYNPEALVIFDPRHITVAPGSRPARDPTEKKRNR